MSTPKPKQAPEAVIERRLVRGVEKMGCECLKLEVKGRAGWPDRVCIMKHGVVVFVEVKKPMGVVSRIQEERIKELQALGQHAFVVKTKDQVDRLLELMHALSLERDGMVQWRDRTLAKDKRRGLERT
jgi:Holliday junction resolvase